MCMDIVQTSMFVVFLLTASGIQSPGATRSPERCDKGRFNGETQSLVLLYHPRTGSLRDQPDLGVQSGQAAEHCHPHAGHRQVTFPCQRCVENEGCVLHLSSVFSGAHSCSAVIWPKTRLPSRTPRPMANSLLRSTAARRHSSFTILLREVNNINVSYRASRFSLVFFSGRVQIWLRLLYWCRFSHKCIAIYTQLYLLLDILYGHWLFYLVFIFSKNILKCFQFAINQISHHIVLLIFLLRIFVSRHFSR